MKLEDLTAMRLELPHTLSFHYFADRESPWLLANTMGESARVGDLKKGPAARFLDRPLVKPVVAASGGTLARADVVAVAHAHLAGSRTLSDAATVGVLAALDTAWHDFELSFCAWGCGPFEASMQMSRAGGNLVVQLGFPSDHAALMGRYLVTGDRKLFEYAAHPVRLAGRPTLAWARLDIEGSTALIEEVQSDWLRFAAAVAARAARRDPRNRALRKVRDYETSLRKRYEKVWPRATLLAVLGLLRDVLGVTDVFMHQPAAGAQLKRIEGRQPPVSLYSQLPRSFGFEPTHEAPFFLDRPRKRDLSRLRRTGEPLFWRLAL